MADLALKPDQGILHIFIDRNNVIGGEISASMNVNRASVEALEPLERYLLKQCSRHHHVYKSVTRAWCHEDEETPRIVKHHHITPVLKSLHWLKTPERT